MNNFPSSMFRPDGQGPWFQPVSADPSSGGLDMPIGSIVAFGAVRYVKWGTAVTNWSIFGVQSNQPLQTVSLLAPAATITVSGLTCDTRNYRIFADVDTVTGGGVKASFNGNMADSQHVFLSDSGTNIDGTAGGYGTTVGRLFNIYDTNVRGNIWLTCKSGKHRYARASVCNPLTTVLYQSLGSAMWATTTGEVTSFTLTGPTNFEIGSKLILFDDGPAT